MKKSIKAISIIFTALFIFSSSTFAQNKTENTNSDNSVENTWTEIGQEGKAALKQTGSFLKSVGTGISETLEETYKSLTIDKLCGTWVYSNKKSSTTIVCNEDKTMSITQRTGMDRTTWSGTYTLGLRVITFTVQEETTQSWFISHKDSTMKPLKWYISFVVIQDDNQLKFISSDIPQDDYGTDFSKGVVFTRK